MRMVPCALFIPLRVYVKDEIPFVPIKCKGNVWEVVLLKQNIHRELVFNPTDLYEELDEEKSDNIKFEYF